MNATEVLGLPLPLGEEHACSVSLPTWQHVVRYEQGDEQLIGALQCAYPRFLRHPLVSELVQLVQTIAWKELTKDSLNKQPQPQGAVNGPKWSFTIAPTEQSAQRLCAFLQHEDVEMRSIEDLVWAIRLPHTLTRKAALFWQHTGEIVSSRCAKRLLKLLRASSSSSSSSANASSSSDAAVVPKIALDHTVAHVQLRDQLVSLAARGATGVQISASSDVYLFPTGMAAIYAAMRMLCGLRPNAKTVLVGFPYGDSLKIHQRTEFVQAGVYFFADFNDQTIAEIEMILQKEQIAGIFTEFPTNPLLACGDLYRLGAVAHQHNTPLVVDDTISSFNINVMADGLADVVVTSLTKIFSGTCNVMGGSLLLNPTSPLYNKLALAAPTFLKSFMYEEDAQQLVQSAKDLESRLAIINANTQVIVTRLLKEPMVAKVFYPSVDLIAKQRYDDLAVSKETVGYGPLVSIVLNGSEQVAAAFYNALRIAKGPSLGTNFSLCCPYTLLAHFNELDFAESCGVDPQLIRFSFGIEPVEDIWRVIQVALEVAQQQVESES